MGEEENDRGNAETPAGQPATLTDPPDCPECRGRGYHPCHGPCRGIDDLGCDVCQGSLYLDCEFCGGSGIEAFDEDEWT